MLVLDPNMTEAANFTTNGSHLLQTDHGEEADHSIFQLVIPGVLLTSFGVLGLVGNLLSVFILSRPQMKSSTHCILIGLASSDSILIITRYNLLCIACVFGLSLPFMVYLLAS